MEQTKKQVDVLYDKVMEVILSDNPYIQKIRKYIDKSTTTNEVVDVLAFLRMSDVLDEGLENPEESLFGQYGLGLRTYAEAKIKRLQKEDKRNGLSLV